MRVAVLSRNPQLYSTHRLVEAGAEHGLDMVVIDHLRCNISIENNNPVIYYHGNRLTDIDAIIPRIGSSVTSYGAAVIKQFEMMNIFSSLSSNALLRSRNKIRSLQKLSNSGLGLPNTVFFDHVNEISQLTDALGELPWVVKLLEGTQGLGVVLVENMNTAESVIEAFNTLKAPVIVQEFIKECAGSDIRILVVDGEIVGAMKRTSNSGFRSNLHRGGTAEIIQLTDQERDTALLACEAMDLHVAGVDILQSNRGPLILEINSSPGLEGIERATEEDIASKIIEYVVSKIKK